MTHGCNKAWIFPCYDQGYSCSLLFLFLIGVLALYPGPHAECSKGSGDTWQYVLSQRIM